jgi:DNA replication protein DnaC
MANVQQAITSLPCTSPNQMSEMIMSNLLISKLGNVMQTDFTLTGSNIFKLLLLLSAGEIKNGINSVLLQFIEYIKKVPDLFLNLVMFSAKFIKPKEQVQPITTTIDNEQQFINIKIEQNFLISLCHYIFKNKNCSYIKSLCNAEIKNTKDNIINTKISEIIINFDDYSLELVDSLTCGHDVYTEEICSVNYNKIEITASSSSYLDLLTDKQRKEVVEIYNELSVIAGKHGLSVIDHVKSKLELKSYNDETFTENTITNLLCKKYPNFNKDKTFLEVCIVWGVVFNCVTYDETLRDIKAEITSRGKLRLDRNSTYLAEEIKTCTKICASNLCRVSSVVCESPKAKYIKTEHYRDYKPIFDKISDQDDGKEMPNKIRFKLLPKTNSTIDPIQVTTNVIKTIYNSYTKSSTKTKIHYVKLVDEVKSSEIPNPEYEKYESKKKYLEQQKVPENPSSLVFFEFMEREIPAKTITKETITKKIECSKLNEMEKDFDTLFLRKDNKDKLKNSLNMFKNKGHTLQKLGLQNKFNLLLYGEPGTGKSTTIQAVANYLQKDVYYIDLQNVSSNEDLHMMFEYVNKNVNNSGIIVMEDIDAMTNVVLKRTDKLQEYKVNDIISNHKGKLSLEYLLNILQGTLTMDNSVYIVTTNHLEHLDPAFYRDGRFDVKIELKLCDKYQIKTIYQKMLDKELPDDVLSKIPDNKFSPANIIYHIKDYIFDNNNDPMVIMAPFITA